MRKLIVLIALLMGVIAGFVPTVSAETFEDPFRCDPYRFPFDFPLKCDSPYTSIQYSLLVRSSSKLEQTITLSMWPEYTPESPQAESSWFTITPTSAILPADSVAAFTIVCSPPFCDLKDLTYRTYLKASTVLSNGYYYERPLTATVRIGTAVPVVDYVLQEGFKIAKIEGNEKTKYTQDQITIGVTNRSNTPNEFVLSPMWPSPPTSEVAPDAKGDFKVMQEMWRDPVATNVYAEPGPNTLQKETGRYSEYRLYTLNSDNEQVDFGMFLGATYDRVTDATPTLAYPYQIAPRKTSDIPFTLRVLAKVPTGIYRLQIRVSPCGISTSGGDYTSVGVEYACKIPIEVTRTTDTPSTSNKVFPFILLGASGLLVAYLGGLYGYKWLRTARQRRQYALTNGKGRNYSTK